VNEELKRLQAIRCSWQWPEWLTAAAIVKTRYGDWLGCERVPTLDDYQWTNTGMTLVLNPLTSFEPPRCDDWLDSLRVNPNREGEHV